MRELFIKTAENLVKNENILSTYKKLADFYLKQNKMDGYSSTLEKIWHLEKDNEILLKISNVAKNNLINFAPIAGINQNLIDDILFEAKTTDFTLLIHRHFICEYMMIHAFSKNNLQLVLELSHYLFEIKSQIQKYIKDNTIEDCKEIRTMKDDDCALSNMLADTKNHNDINDLAIQLNPLNEKAYINIIYDLLIYENYDRALEFYNSKYAPTFSKSTINSVSELCWIFSESFSKRFEFYETLLFQKIAIEQELKN